jgi:glycosyltransferase involved in cell wall biosynthesis
MYNEADSVDAFMARLIPAMEKLEMEWEVICVDDGSRDETLEKLIAHRGKDPSIKILSLSRNFGKEIALTAGLDAACGDAVVPIDADLQDPPEVIAELAAKWREGFDVVLATRRARRGETLLKTATASLFYRVYNRLSDTPMPADTGDFRLMDRRVVLALQECREAGRFMKGLFSWVGFRQTAVIYDRDPRHGSRTSWSYCKLWKFALGGLISHGGALVRMWTYIGALAVLAALFGGVSMAIYNIAHPGAEMEPWLWALPGMLFLSGLQMAAIGMLGEYVSRILREVQRRPLYVVREKFGIKDV